MQEIYQGQEANVQKAVDEYLGLDKDLQRRIKMKGIDKIKAELKDDIVIMEDTITKFLMEQIYKLYDKYGNLEKVEINCASCAHSNSKESPEYTENCEPYGKTCRIKVVI